MLMLVFGAISAIPTAEANEVMNNEHLDADTSVPEINLGNLIFENPFWSLAGVVFMVSKDNKRQRKPRRAKIKIAPEQNRNAGKNQKGTQQWAADALGIETPYAFMDRVVKLCAHEEQGNFLEVLKNELKEQYSKIANRVKDPVMRFDYLLHTILAYPEVLKKNTKHLKHSMLHISFNHDKLFTLLKGLSDELDFGPYKLSLPEEKHIPALIQMGYTKAATKVAKLQVKKAESYKEYKSSFSNDGWEKFRQRFNDWAVEAAENNFVERNMTTKADTFGVQIMEVALMMKNNSEDAAKRVERDLRTQYNKNADKSTIPLDKQSWMKMKVSQAKTGILAKKLRRFKIVMTKNSQDYLVWHCTSMPENMVAINRNGESTLKSRSDWDGLRCYFGPTNGVKMTPFWNVKKEGKLHYTGDVLSYCKMRGVHSPLFSNDDEFNKNGAHLYTWMNLMLNRHSQLKARLAGLYIIAAVLKTKGKDITELESKPLYVKNVNRVSYVPRKKSNKNRRKNKTDVKLAEQLEELKDKVHSGDEYDIRRYKTEKLDSNTIADAIGGLDNIPIVDDGPLWPDTTTVKELRERCKELALTGYSSMKKAELLALVRSHDEPKLPKSRNRKKGSKKSKTPKFD